MDADKSVTATFAPITHTLNVTKEGTGSGTVTSADNHISCGATCSHNYADGSSITLTATPAGGSTFDGWSGGGCSGTGTCQISDLTADTTVTATFTQTAPPPPTTHILTVAKSGSGSGTVSGTSINCGPTCSQTYVDGTSVTLTATPANGSTFDGWSGGGCAGTMPCTVSMTADRTVTATFTSNPPPPPESPTISGTALSGLAHRKPKLGFALAAGANAPPLKQIVVSPPARLGLTLSTKPGSLVKGVHIKGPGGAPLAFTPAVQHGTLVISLQSPATQLTVSIATPAITESKALQRRVKRRSIKQLTFIVTATDAAGTATPFSLKLTP
jgi:uncharacterized repeat protein (TIGR02543 family)